MKGLFERFLGRHAKNNLSDESADRLAVLERKAAGTLVENVAKMFVGRIRDGVWPMEPTTDDIRTCTEMVATGTLLKQLQEIARGALPEAKATVLIFDPLDGPGAGQDSTVLETALGDISDDATDPMLLGMATQWDSDLSPRPKLRAMVLVGRQLQGSRNGEIKGLVGVLYGYRTTTGECRWGRLVHPVDRRADGTFVAGETTEETFKAPFVRQMDLIKACFDISDAANKLTNFKAPNYSNGKED